MAWQQPNLGGGGPVGGGDNNGPPATEYTLQGVMRFLQLEWHNHERARNAWDIERAEMKAKIAKQEGDVRSAKKLNDQLDKQIRMLEMALKNERAKNKAAKTDDKVSAQNKQHNSFLDVDIEGKDGGERFRDGQRDKSKAYMTKCVEEITYLLTPPMHAPMPPSNAQSLGNSVHMMNSQEPLQMEEMYLQRQRAQHQTGFNQSHPSSVPNHQSQPIPSMSDIPNLPYGNQQAPHMTREPSGQQILSQSMGYPSTSMSSGPAEPDSPQAFVSIHEEPAERITHSFDAAGKPVAAQEDEISGTRHIVTDESDWNFDESSQNFEASADGQATRRPDTDVFPSASTIPAKSPPRIASNSHRRRSSGPTAMSRHRSEGNEVRDLSGMGSRSDHQNFTVRFALRGHLDVVRSVIFTGGGSPSEPEICTAGDDGMIKRWIIPASYASQHSVNNDLDIQSYFTHRGHEGIVTSLAACPAAANFATGGRASGDGWIFSGGQDSSVRVWERGRVDPKATLEGHTDAVWSVCVLPTTCAAVFGPECNNYGGPDRILLASGSADGTIKIWAVSAPPQAVSPSTGSRRGVGGSRRVSVTSGSNYPSSPQPSVATLTPFNHMLVHNIVRPTAPSPTCISPLSPTGDNFVVSYTDSAVLVFDTRTGDEIIGMASAETYDGNPRTGINTVVASSLSLDGSGSDNGRIPEDESVIHGATGSMSEGSVEGVVISGHEDQYIRFFDANSGQCTYSMLAHPSAISSLSLSKDGREAVSAGHDASIRFWSLEKRICTQELTSHRIMRGEGVCSVVWSQDGRLVVSAGGDGVVKVFAR
ncbi:striatin Pro11 [Pseudovirgaria hyperparasitica]|uniref:Striatin Pro11 n=1 Tax=Pseudovirgaria hyperparasitica TaxID=470096 RepID=A0A6A6VZY7_9PEZI|nr:striatin Pro11 [Pseudovirgaria hyperparasitica]KAF2756212.1 striatin Pro11 [Pseudovirgaria hyperparasitica]